jgi:hypothetical protein
MEITTTTTNFTILRTAMTPTAGNQSPTTTTTTIGTVIITIIVITMVIPVNPIIIIIIINHIIGIEFSCLYFIWFHLKTGGQ